MELKIILLLLFTVLATQLPSGESAKILGLFTSHVKSHVIIHMSVAKALVERGHNLTIVTTIDLNDSNPKYRHVKVPGSKFDNIMTDMIKMSPMEKLFNTFNVITTMMSNSKIALQSSEMKKLMNEESFDLVLLGYFVNQYEIGIAAHFKCPAVLIWMVQPIYPINQLIGNPHQISHVPNVIWSVNPNLGFFSRVKNALWHVFDNVLWCALNRVYNQYYVELFPPEKYPPYEEALKSIALVLSNYHFSQGLIRADVPAVIPIGGIAIEENPKPLPEDIKRHLDSATKDGAIFFSLGTNFRSSDLDANVTTAIYNVLSTLKQKVIWKWDTEKTPGNSKNILYKKWFPQNSVLAHPNMKLFITHGGKGSVVESEYFGIPMIGLPLFGDQPANVDQFVEQGYGLRLDYQRVTEDELKNTINEIITNPKYSENTKRCRDLFLDRPMTPKQSAVYWVEYVIRHNGAKHMQSPAVNMPLYQLMGLDVIALIGGILYLWFKITKCVCKFLWRKCCGICCRGSSKKPGLSNKKDKSKSKKE